MATFEDFKPIRNRIRKFDADKLLELEIRMMHDLQDMAIEKVRHCPPWYLMLLIKWTLMHGEFNSAKKAPTRKDLVDLINMVHRLWKRVNLPSEHSGLMLMKSIAFQQFWYQTGIASADIGRQLKLFLELLPRNFVDEIFHSIIGTPPDAFFELAFALTSHFMSKKDEIIFHTNAFAPLKTAYSAEIVHRVLTRLSCDLEAIGDFLKSEDSRVRDFDARLYEQTPLRRRPLLRIGESYICYSPNVLMSGLSTLAYDIFKAQLPEQFTEKFGRGFEKYVSLGLLHSGLSFLEEARLKKLYPGRKMVDFIVTLPDANVLIESKAIEMSPLAQVSPDVRIVANNLRDSIIKAIKQAMIAIKCIKETPIEGGGDKDNFLLIVTFKDLFLGSGSDFVVGDVRKEIEEFASRENLDSQWLPSEHIFFLSAREFEWTMEACKNRQENLSAMIRDMIEANRNPMTRKFLVEQHLQERFGAIKGPDYVSAPYDKMFNDLVLKFKKQ